MGLHGEIQTMPMLDLFQWLELVKKTGKLVVDSPQAKQQIYFEEGAIITASSTAYYSTDSQVGVEAIVSDTLKWKRGEFSFLEAPLPGDVTTLSQRLSPKGIIMKTFQQMDESADAFRQVVAVSSQMGDKEKGYDEVEGLRTAIVSRLLKGDFQIPLLPTVANKIMSITRQDDYSLRDLSEVIITDQVITAQLLKHANSAFYNRGRTIDSISMAVQLLGAQTVTNLVLTLSLRSVVTGRDVFLENKKLVWKRSLACALLARSLSGIAQVDREQAFLCGLMIDFGKIVLYSLIQDLMHKEPHFQATSKPVIDYIINSYHQKVGGTVAEKWMLPPTVLEAITNHRTLTSDSQLSKYVPMASLCNELLQEYFDPSVNGVENFLPRAESEWLVTPGVKLLNLNQAQIHQILELVPECLSYAQQMAS
ncbi:MAG: HDOD domain-containing protein [Acidobacteria bacterium]|nr:HDOD domain-containing protein [Acidobacteriota bacterium]